MNGGDFEIWKIFLGIGAFLTPIVLAAFARDRSLLSMIAAVKDDASQQIKASVDQVHERINRVRDEFVRRDDLDGHLQRMEKRFDEVWTDMRRNNDAVAKRLDEIMARLPPQ